MKKNLLLLHTNKMNSKKLEKKFLTEITDDNQVLHNDDSFDIIMLINIETATLSIVCHETVHLVQIMLEQVNEKDNFWKTETFAYMIEYFFSKVCKTLTKNKIVLNIT